LKRDRNELTAALQSVGKYNARYRDVAVAAATLAAVAEIAIEHPESASWKQNAPIVRDLAAKTHDAASASGGQAFQAAKAPYEQLVDALDGNPPADLPASPPRRDFSQVADRGAVMKRMDSAFQSLKKSGSSPAAFRKESTRALHEAALLAALSRVITVGHYESADDPKYKTQAEGLTKAALEAKAAAKSEEGTAFRDAVTRVQKRCDACHADFRF
jgi:hypothetical protein